MAYKAMVVEMLLLCSLNNEISNAEDGLVKFLRANMKRLHRQHYLRDTLHQSITSSVIKGRIEAPVNVGSGEFVVIISIGSPPTKVVGIVDTGNDLIWTQLQPCTNYFTHPDPIFDPSKSTTYDKVPCTTDETSLCSSLLHPNCTPYYQYLYRLSVGSSTSEVLSSDIVKMSNT
ncbi:hypothetical protein KI387_000129, partial [Taxus chinensis]